MDFLKFLVSLDLFLFLHFVELLQSCEERENASPYFNDSPDVDRLLFQVFVEEIDHERTQVALPGLKMKAVRCVFHDYEC
jgi:hypothetical protein